MERFTDLINWIELEYGTGVLFLTPFILVIGAVAKWRLFVKCDQPGIGAILPIYDFILTLRIVGRPDWHIFLVLIPVYNLYFLAKLLIELAQSFGKKTMLDYVLVLVFSVFYVLNLGLSYDEKYAGPVYGGSSARARNPQLA